MPYRFSVHTHILKYMTCIPANIIYLFYHDLEPDEAAE